MSTESQESKTERIAAAVTSSEKAALDLVRTVDGDLSSLLRKYTITELVARGLELQDQLRSMRRTSEPVAA